jgi:PadR family transcriptional regulator PadR
MNRQPWLYGFLDICLLSLLAEHLDYGRSLMERLQRVGFDPIPGGTLYPALLRLEKQGMITASREASAVGPVRKYYEITEAGRARVNAQREQWVAFRASMDDVLASAGDSVACAPPELARLSESDDALTVPESRIAAPLSDPKPHSTRQAGATPAHTKERIS